MHFRHVTLIEVWRQALVENADVVELGTERYPVRTPKRGLRQVDFVFEGNEVRGWNRTQRRARALERRRPRQPHP